MSNQRENFLSPSAIGPLDRNQSGSLKLRDSQRPKRQLRGAFRNEKFIQHSIRPDSLSWNVHLWNLKNKKKYEEMFVSRTNHQLAFQLTYSIPKRLKRQQHESFIVYFNFEFVVSFQYEQRNCVLQWLDASSFNDCLRILSSVPKYVISTLLTEWSAQHRLGTSGNVSPPSGCFMIFCQLLSARTIEMNHQRSANSPFVRTVRDSNVL